jgi:hypothetical protein
MWAVRLRAQERFQTKLSRSLTQTSTLDLNKIDTSLTTNTAVKLIQLLKLNFSISSKKARKLVAEGYITEERAGRVKKVH